MSAAVTSSPAAQSSTAYGTAAVAGAPYAGTSADVRGVPAERGPVGERPEPSATGGYRGPSATRTSSAISPSDDSANFDRLRAAAVELGLSTRAYLVGASAEGFWSVLREGSGWAVFRTEHGVRHDFASLPTSQQATAYLIGQLYLTRGVSDVPADDSPDDSPAAEEHVTTAQRPGLGVAAASGVAAAGLPGRTPGAEPLIPIPPSGTRSPGADIAGAEPSVGGTSVTDSLEPPTSERAETAEASGTPAVSPALAPPGSSAGTSAAVEADSDETDAGEAPADESDVEEDSEAKDAGVRDAEAADVESAVEAQAEATDTAGPSDPDLVSSTERPHPPAASGPTGATASIDADGATGLAGQTPTTRPDAAQLDKAQSSAVSDQPSQPSAGVTAPTGAATGAAAADTVGDVARPTGESPPAAPESAAATTGDAAPAEPTGAIRSPASQAAAAGRASLTDLLAAARTPGKQPTSDPASTLASAAGQPGGGTTGGSDATAAPADAAPSATTAVPGADAATSTDAASPASAAAVTPDEQAGVTPIPRPSSAGPQPAAPQAGQPKAVPASQPAGQQPSTEPPATQPPATQPPATQRQSTEPPAGQQPTTQQPSTQSSTQQSSAQQAGTQAASQWKIQPLPGDPPLTLYRDKRIVLLPAGTELDRFGEPAGNVTYAARTEYRQRSLPAEWRSFPYHAYRLQRPLEALTGLAVPWFEQPGGGTAFVLPLSIAELVADGSLAEIEGATAPSD